MNNVADVVWSINWPDLTVNYVSPSVEQVFGRPVSEFMENTNLWAEAVHPDDKQITEHAFGQLFPVVSI